MDATALHLLDKHQAGAAINPRAWRQPRTSKKRRLAQQPQIPSRIEALSLDVYDGHLPPFEGSDRGNKKRARRAAANARVSETRPLHHMHSAERRRAQEGV